MCCIERVDSLILNVKMNTMQMDEYDINILYEGHLKRKVSESY